jgi:hypothetical protein
VATRSGQQEPEKAEVVEELLDALDAALDRVKVLYEQYFLGIQKQPPTYLHTDLERKIRDITQLQVRNTALRYRFATLQQKFGSYNAYWRRTLRQIENGTYTRSLSKIGRQAGRTGAAVPEEILAAMPKRMREQVKRDREAALALAELRTQPWGEPELLMLDDDDVDFDDLDDVGAAAFLHESPELPSNVLTTGGAHQVDQADAELDIDAFFAQVTSEREPSSAELPEHAVGAAPVAGPPSAAAGPPSAAAGLPSAVAGPPSATAGQPPGLWPTPPRAIVPPVGAGATQALPRISGLPPWQPARPNPPKPPPSQATPPIPVLPGAAAARAPTAGETFAGPFPRIPSLPSKLRAASGAPPAAAAPAPSTEHAAPAQAADRAAPPSPAPSQAPASERAATGERPLVVEDNQVIIPAKPKP